MQEPQIDTPAVKKAMESFSCHKRAEGIWHGAFKAYPTVNAQGRDEQECLQTGRKLIAWYLQNAKAQP